MSNMLSLEEHNSLYRELHKKTVFNGYSLLKHIPEIMRLTQNSNIRSILDFGCGKAGCWFDFNLSEMLQIKKIGLYDPGVEKFSVLPEKEYDMVICTDVLEHIPEHLVDEILHQIFSRTRKLAFISISTKPASKTLPNGDNAHATVKPKEWWLEKLKKYNKLTITHFD